MLFTRAPVIPNSGAPTLNANVLIPRERIHQEQGRFVGHLRDRIFTSAYQPIVSPALMRPIGVEALLRIQQPGGPLAPAELFASLADDEAVEACRLARALHVMNAPPLPQGNEWLFLNVHPEAIRRRLDPSRIASELRTLDMTPTRIVIEVTASAGMDPVELRDFVAEFRSAGFRIAIDDFGSGVSDYDRIVEIEPDIVKVDRSLIANAAASMRARRLFPHAVGLLREAGALVVVEGIENAEQAQIAIDADAELLQGWFFGRPAAHAPDTAGCRERMDGLLAESRSGGWQRRSETDSFRGRFLDAWSAFRDGGDIGRIADAIDEPRITRLYVIDNRGFQIGDTALTRSAVHGNPHPLANAMGACWVRRPYFRNAMEQPGRIQVTRPYLSLTEQRLCVTFSCATSRPDHGSCVVCMDVLVDN